MKIEKRGKYAGVKVHLEPDEVEVFLRLDADVAKSPTLKQAIEKEITYFSLSAKLGKKIKHLLIEEPDLLQPRTEEEIKAELENEFESAKLKLEAISQKKDWKEIHIK